jgi:hypothetical protein
MPKLEAPTGQAEPKAEKKLRLSGTFKFDWRNRNEKYPNNRILPNNFMQGRLNLTYEINDDRQLFLEERYLHRRRNEPVIENRVSLGISIGMTRETHSRSRTLCTTYGIRNLTSKPIGTTILNCSGIGRMENGRTLPISVWKTASIRGSPDLISGR